MRNYETPEIVELGDARELTLGRPNLSCDDNCECTKSGGGDSDLALA